MVSFAYLLMPRLFFLAVWMVANALDVLLVLLIFGTTGGIKFYMSLLTNPSNNYVPLKYPGLISNAVTLT
ncbi:hypothetical protein [Undibacterium sp. Ji49W]|uniref:hypothetical protein n=1 Tax=Undibacterium sp. Ji49W TaxID=3413040 RepID=UPI003BF13FAE